MRGTDGSWVPSPGGLVRARLPMLRDVGGAWVGWTGIVDDDAEPFALDGVDLVPVEITPSEHDDYYEGFANDSLWPLYHDAVRALDVRVASGGRPTSRSTSASPTAAEVAPPGAAIWVHDYHLQLVPGDAPGAPPGRCASASSCTSRSRRGSCSCRLPWRGEIIEGLLGADLVGFQRPRRRELRSSRSAGCSRRRQARVTRPATLEAPAAVRHDRRLPDLHRRRRVRRGRRRPASVAGRRQRCVPARQPRVRPARRRPPRLHQGHRRAAAGVRDAASPTARSTPSAA